MCVGCFDRIMGTIADSRLESRAVDVLRSWWQLQDVSRKLDIFNESHFRILGRSSHKRRLMVRPSRPGVQAKSRRN
jgi:hypothetical protein